MADLMLGRKPRRSDVRSLHFADFATSDVTVPKRTRFWARKKPFPRGSWGNDEVGDCTIAKQCNMFMRFERIEANNRGTISVSPDEAKRAYFAMTQRLYGGGDTGAYEEDALNCSRSEETCLHDVSGHPLLIDAYVRLDASNQQQLRQAMAAAAGHGIAVCMNLPLAFRPLVSRADGTPLDVPIGAPLVGDWEPGTWGGHSLWSFEYDEEGVWLDHTWDLPPQLLTWRGAAAYLDEAHLVIDSVDLWKKRKAAVDLDKLVKAVNRVSQHKVHSVAT